MENQTLAFITSLIAMLLIMASYFFKKKELYLLFQAAGMVFLIANYFFTLQFVAMLGLVVGLFRALVFFFYERKDKLAPIAWAFLFSALSIAAYFIAKELEGDNKPNNEFEWKGMILVVSLALYAFIFRIRDLRLMRFTVLAPTSLALLYNILIRATQSSPFAILTYAFELGANIVSILKYHVFGKEETKQTEEPSKEKTYEEN